MGVVGVALLVFCLVAVGFVFFCCVFLPGGIVAIADEVTMASYGRAVTGTAVMARSANEEKKIAFQQLSVQHTVESLRWNLL